MAPPSRNFRNYAVLLLFCRVGAPGTRFCGISSTTATGSRLGATSSATATGSRLGASTSATSGGHGLDYSRRGAGQQRCKAASSQDLFQIIFVHAPSFAGGCPQFDHDPRYAF